MWHVVGQNDGELDQSADDLLGIILVPRRLVDEFLFAFLRDGVDIGNIFLNHMANHLPRLGVMALLKIAVAGVAIHLDGTVVLINHVADLVAHRDSDIDTFEEIHNNCIGNSLQR